VVLRIRGGVLHRLGGAAPARIGRVGMSVKGHALTLAFGARALGPVARVFVRVRTVRAGALVDAAPDDRMLAHVLEPPALPRALRGPAVVAPGEPAAFAATGFPPGRRLTVLAVPTRHRGDDGYGVAIPLAFRTNAVGAARVAFRMPRTYLRCVDDACRPVAWTRGEPVDFDACTTSPATGLACARAVARVAA